VCTAANWEIFSDVVRRQIGICRVLVRYRSSAQRDRFALSTAAAAPGTPDELARVAPGRAGLFGAQRAVVLQEGLTMLRPIFESPQELATDLVPQKAVGTAVAHHFEAMNRPVFASVKGLNYFDGSFVSEVPAGIIPNFAREAGIGDHLPVEKDPIIGHVVFDLVGNDRVMRRRVRLELVDAAARSYGFFGSHIAGSVVFRKEKLA
jgi:hypothetical protein